MTGWLTLLGVFQGGFVAGLTVAILYLYVRHLGALTKIARHVILVGVSYLMLTILSLVSVASGFYPVASWRMGLLLLAYGLGDYALVMMLAVQYERLGSRGID